MIWSSENNLVLCTNTDVDWPIQCTGWPIWKKEEQKFPEYALVQHLTTSGTNLWNGYPTSKLIGYRITMWNFITLYKIIIYYHDIPYVVTETITTPFNQGDLYTCMINVLINVLNVHMTDKVYIRSQAFSRKSFNVHQLCLYSPSQQAGELVLDIQLMFLIIILEK